jgi:hypothetical protein
MKKIIVGFALSILVIAACNNQPKLTNCEALHKGTFSYFAKTKTGEKIAFTIYRTDSMQIEVANGSTDTAFFSIDWISSCNYNLLLQRASFAIDEKQFNISHTIPMINSIDNVGSNFYVFTAERKASDFKLTDTITIE